MANKYKDKSFADIAKMILKEVEAKPNDPIAKRTADEMMSRLAQAQEEYNYKREQRKLAKDFDRLSTEDKMGLVQMMQQPVQNDKYAQPMQDMSQNGGNLYQDGKELDLLAYATMEGNYGRLRSDLYSDGSIRQNLNGKDIPFTWEAIPYPMRDLHSNILNKITTSSGNYSTMDEEGNIIPHFKDEDSLKDAVDFALRINADPTELFYGKEKTPYKTAKYVNNNENKLDRYPSGNPLKYEGYRLNQLNADDYRLDNYPNGNPPVYNSNQVHIPSKIKVSSVNNYADGGDIKKAVMQALNIHTQSDLDKVLDWHNLKESDIDWNDIKNNPALLKVIANDSPALADAIAKGYDFGAYNASGLPTATLDFNQKGNWDRTSGRDWLGSSDLAYTQAVEGLTDDEIRALTREQLAQRMRNTEAYKNTTKWLQDENNALAYLNTLMNYKSTPQGARNWASRFIEKGADGRWSWKPNVNYDYNTIIGKYREDNAPGSYWYTAREANRGDKNINYVINDDGSIEEILTTPDASWIKDNTYNWADVDNNYTATYYRRPTTTVDEGEAAASPDTTATEPIKDNLLRHMPTIGNGLQALAAFNTPADFTYSNALNRIAGEYQPIASPAIGGYRRYNPYDINLTNNQNLAQLSAAQRANRESANRWNQTAANIGTFNAAANQNALNNLAWQRANEENRLNTDTYNLGIDKTDMDLVRAYDALNADITNRRAAMKQASAKAADDATTLTSTNRSQSLTNFLNNLGAMGKENMQFALVNKAIRDGVLKGLGNEDLYTSIFNWLGNTKVNG